MKKYLTSTFGRVALLWLLIITVNTRARAQVNGGYSFSQTNGTYTAITGTTLSFGGTTTAWDNNIVSLALPFSFTFNGAAYSTCNVSSNGFITFGATAPTATNYSPISAGGAFTGVISAMGCDLDNNGTAITYKTNGTAPNQTLVIQWTAARRWNSGRTTVLADNINFQIVLTQTTNAIQFVYGTNTAAATGISTCVGLRGASNNDFNARNSFTSWASTITGTTDTATVTTNSTIMPASGLTFSFTPCFNSPLAMPVSQGFNSTNAPGCWNQQFVSGTKSIQFVPGPTTKPATSPEEGSDFVYWNSNSYPAGTETRLVSPPVITTGTAKVQVTFYWYAENSTTLNTGAYLNEGATLEYSLDNSTWTAVQTISRLDTTLASGTGQWESKIIDLPAIAGNQPVVYVGFDFLSESGRNCSLDNVTIKPVPANDAGVSGFVVPTPLTPSSQLIKVIITNYGSSTLTSATVNWSVDGTAQTPQTFTGLSVAPDSTTTVSLGTYSFPNGTGANTITASTSLPNGLADGNPSNDSYTAGSLYTALTGTYTVGVGQNFTSLTAAVAYANTYGICGPTIFSLTDAAYGANETFPIILNSVTTAINTLTIQPATGVTATISGTSTTGMFDLNGASYVTFNGGTGTQRNLIFSSSGALGYNIQTNNGCLNIVANNCAFLSNGGDNVDIEGTGVATIAVRNCDLHEYTSGSYALNGVYVNNKNAAVTINSNNIYNFTNSGVQVNLCADACLITNNSFWYAGTATTPQQAIYVLSGSNHQIKGNYIGGQGAAGGVAGSPWLNSSSGSFYGILVTAFTGGGLADTISGNIIQNISLTNTGSPAFYGINVQAGKIVIGYAGNGNTIGNNSANLGIVNNGNTSAYVQGIWAAGGALTAQYNTIANLSAPSANNVSATASTVGGIYMSNGANGTVVGYNTIHDLTNASPDTVDFSRANYGSAFNVQGIVMQDKNTSGNLIQNNTIYALRSTVTSAYYTAVAGIAMDSTGSGSVFDNLVYDLTNTATATSSLPGIIGIRDYNGTWKIYNNQVELTNAGNTNAVDMYGISDMSGNASNYFFNSIYIGGGASTGAGLSAAWNMLSVSNTIVLRNNLLYNVRTNTGTATGNNYSIALTVPTAPTAFNSNYNDLYSAGTAANYIGLKSNTAAPKTFASWQALFSPGDSSSQNALVYFNQSNPPVNDLTPAAAGNCWLYGKGTPITTPTYAIAVATDYSNTVRNTSTPDIGAAEFTAATITAPVITATNVLCKDSANATVTVSTLPAGGVSPYKYSLNSGTYGTAVLYSNLVPNTYTVTAEDANKCKVASNSVVVTQPAASLTSPVITSANVICHGGGNGSVTVSTLPAGGTGTYQYSINTGTYQTSTNFSPLSAGNYTVTVEDANNCTAVSNTAHITNPPALVAPVITSTNVLCHGAANGSVTVSTLPTGGTGAYQYSVASGTYQTGTVFTPLIQGNYTVTAEDANNCTVASNQVTISNPSALVAPVITATNITCSGANNGTVTVSTLPTGGAGSYQYSIASGTYQTAINFTLLGAGTYTVTAQDANNCTVAGNQVIITNPSPLVAPVITATNITCNGLTNGKVKVTTVPTGGTGTYQYSLNGGTYQTGINFTLLGAGNYTVTAQDGNNCTVASNQVTVANPAALTTPVITATNITCNNLTNGKVKVTTVPTGGTGTYQYSLNGGTYQTAVTFTALGAGNYTVMAKDANNCTVLSSQVSITNPPALVAPVITATNITCHGSANGTVTVSTMPMGGTGTYQYSLASGTYQTAVSFASLGAGNYTVTAQDANSCTVVSNQVTVTNPAALTAPVITPTALTCLGAGNGAVNVTTLPTGGTGSYQYSLNSGAYQTSTAFTGLSSGQYTVVAEDANNCTATSNTVNVTHPAALIAPVITATNITCNGANNGIVTVSTGSTGGTSPYQYSVGGAYQTGTSFTALSTGTYAVTVQDANNCTKTSNSVTITQPAALTAPVITRTNVTCHGASDGKINVSTIPTGGTAPYQYSLNGGTYQTSTAFSNLVPNTYTVTAQDANGCTIASTSKTITQPAVVTPSVSIAITGGAQTICAGTSDTITASAVNGGTAAGYNFMINGVTAQNGASPTFIHATYNNNDIVSCVLTSNATCVTPATASSNTIRITVNPILTASVTIDPTPNYIICSNSTLKFTAVAVNGGTAPAYQWQINSGSGYVNVGNNAPTYSSNTPVNGNLVRCVMSSSYVCPNAISDTSNETTMIVGSCTNIWLGNSTSWDDVANWSAGTVPGNCADGANFPPGVAHYPVLTKSESVGNVLIQAGASINLSTYNLAVCGNWDVPATGTSITGTGQLVFDGISADSTQLISGKTSVNEININTTDGGGVVLASGANITVSTALDLQKGNINVSAGNFTFTSASANQVAILDNFSHGFSGTITGAISAQRYYDKSTYIVTWQHMLGTPVSNQVLGVFGAAGASGAVTPQGDCDENYLPVNSLYGKVFSLKEANGTTCGVASWYVENATSPAVAAQGYSVILPPAGTLTLTGTPNLNSSYTLSGLTNSNWVNYTAQNHRLSSGWQLLSNPYLATLQITASNTGIDNQIQVWQANGPYSGTYQPGMVNNNAIVAPFQAFMVHVTNPGTGSFTIHGTDRVRAPATFFVQNANQLDIIAENLGNHLLDKTQVAFNSAATDSFDVQYDANKVSGSNSRHTLYTLNNDIWMAINTLHDVATTSAVTLGFEAGANGNYSLAFGNLNTFDATTYIMLEDKQQSIMYNVRNGNYQFSADSADARERFVLHFTPPAIITAVNATCNTLGNISITQPGTANWTYTLTDASNTTVSTGILNQNAPVSLSAVVGTYTLTLVDGNNYTVTKTITISGQQPVAASFNTPLVMVTTQTAVSFTNTSQNANTYSWNFGDGFTSALINPVHTYVAPGTYTVELTATNATGCSAASSQVITVNNATTAINTVTEKGITLWSNKNKVYIDFTGAGIEVNATIKIYDVLGQQLSDDKFTPNGLYQKEIDNLEAAYVIVQIQNAGAITTQKLFINNIGK